MTLIFSFQRHIANKSLRFLNFYRIIELRLDPRDSDPITLSSAALFLFFLFLRSIPPNDLCDPPAMLDRLRDK